MLDCVTKKSLMTFIMAAFVFFSLMLEALPIQDHPAAEDQYGKRGERYFTVRDSIEMKRFGESDPVFSPDGKFFAVVTSRGIMKTNQIESTLNVFSVEALPEHLHENGTKELTPTVVAKLAAIPKMQYPALYTPIIFDVRWAKDSRRLLFLAQNSSGNRQLYEASMNGTSAKQLTPSDKDISQFDFANGTIVYRVMHVDHTVGVGEAVNADAYDITGMDLPTVLFPGKYFPGKYDGSGDSTLWVNRNRRSRPVVNARTGQPVRLLDTTPVIWSTLSISPDGKSVITLLPVTHEPPSWDRYIPFRPTVHHFDRSQYTVIDLGTGESRALVDAPNGYTLGYGNQNQATWSPDGRHALLVNTFLPFEGVDGPEQSERVRPCAAAVVDLTQSITRCVVYRKEKPVLSSAFGQTEDDVVLRFLGDLDATKFHFQNGAWGREASPGGGSQPLFSQACVGPRQNLSRGILIEVVQDLNDPPVLSATDCATGRRKRIWDPNPQFANMKFGEASIIHWKSADGYEWKGVLTKPPDYTPGKRYPLVIEPYGFEEHAFVTDGLHTTAYASRPLASAGMLVLEFWFRFDHAGTADEAGDQIKGYESAIDKLAAEGIVDPKKIGIIGFSRTCYHVESALISDPGRFAAATLADGVDESYIQSMLAAPVQKEGEAIYGTKPIGEGLKTWIRRAPGFLLDQIRTPLRIESIGPFSVLNEWEIYASLSTQKKPVNFIYIPDGQHTLQKPLDRMASQQGNVDWFRFWLRGEEDPDPVKARQYVRWRKLRAENANMEALHGGAHATN